MDGFINTIFGGFTSWKTSLAGIIAALAVLFKMLGWFEITAEQQITILAFCVLLIGWFSKDSSQTGLPFEDD